MAKGITYTAMGNDGIPHTRYSAGHTVPRYTHAVIECGTTSFAGSLENACRERDSRAKYFVRSGGKSYYGDTLKAPYVVPVTAEQGRTNR